MAVSKPATKQSDAQLIAAWWKSHGVVTPAHVRKLKVRHVSQAEATRLLSFDAPAGGFVLQYFDLDGKPTDFFRVRFDDHTDAWATTLATKQRRYSQPKGSGIHLYLPPLVDWQAVKTDANVRLVFVEGECKSAALCAQGIYSPALGGVSSWRGTKQAQRLMPDIAQFDLCGREVIVLFDSDAGIKPTVLSEECAFAQALSDAGASVKVTRLPALSDGSKCGPDDFLLEHSAEELLALIDVTPEFEGSREMYELDAKYSFITSLVRVATYPTPHEPKPLLFKPKEWSDYVEASRVVTQFKPDGTPYLAQAAPLWLRRKARPEYAGYVYEPGRERVIQQGSKLCLNLWMPSTCEPTDGDVTPCMELVELLIPNAELREWALGWLAYPHQFPGAKLPTAMVLLSLRQGLGKSTLCELMIELYGSHNCSTITQADLDSQFNSAFHARQLVISEESTGGQGRKFGDRLKHFVTGSTIRVNEKFQPTIELDNHANLIAATNHADAFHLDGDDRRFAILESISAPRPAQFYKDFHKWRADGGAGRFLGFLLRRDLSAFNPHGRAPDSEAKKVMVAASRSVLGSWVHELKDDPDAVTIHSHSTCRTVLSLHSAEELLSMFDGGLGRCSTKAMALALRTAGFTMALDGQQIRLSDRKKRLWVIRNGDRIGTMREAELASVYVAERAGKPLKYALPVLKGGRAAAK